MSDPKPVSFKTNQPSFAEKVRKRLHASFGVATDKRCLLLDHSSSMGESAGGGYGGPTKMEQLRKIAAKFPGERIFVFDSTCEEIPPDAYVPDPRGGTAMHLAFLTIKAAGILHAVLVTDGIPDNVAYAIRDAVGLRLDIFYVGPDPAPPVLKQLADMTGGEYEQTTLFADGLKRVESKIRGLLAPPGGGVIKL